MTSAGSSPPRPWPGPRPGPPPSGPVVEVADDQAALAVDVAGLAALARAVLVDQGVQRGELALTFVDEAAMAALNHRHLGSDGPTDVLAFPLDASTDDEGDDPGVPLLLGDVVVCPAVAERNGAASAAATDDELALLVVHGVLHVLGMDHAEADEAAVMQAAERDALARLHHSDGLWAVEHGHAAQLPREARGSVGRR